MKFAIFALIGAASSIKLSAPLIHPETGLAITTTGQHWYGQPPLALAEPAAAATTPANNGYPEPEKVHILDPKIARTHTTFYNQNKAQSKDLGSTHYDPWVKQFVSGIVSPVPTSGRATSPDGSWKPEDAYRSESRTRMAQVDPVPNTCTNANKATGVDQDCSTPGNSAWNTISTSRTGDPTKAQAAPYPDHTLH